MLNSSRGWLLVVLLIIVGFVEWRIAPGPPALPSHLGRNETWALPKIRSPQTNQALVALGRFSLWGKLPKTATEYGARDKAWRFLAIATNGPERYVLIKMAGQPEQRLTIDDTLPGGSKILKIDTDTLCILVKGKKRRIGIYGMGRKVL